MAVITMPGPLAVFIGDNEPNVSWDGLQNFCVMAVELISRTAAAPRTCDGGGCPQGSPEREAGKQAFTDLMRGNMWIVTIACALYVVFVFVGPRLISKPLPVVPVLQVWNLALAIFSFTGSFHCAGALLGNLKEHGFRYTVCQLPKKIDMQGYDLDIWVSFFVLSKVGEFLDTVLKICLMKKFLFLHWYHHLMTAWLGWLSLAYDASPGQWYAGINYTVHGPMYTYFFLSSVLSRPMFDRWCRPIAPFITTIQIIQMIVYVAVNSFASYYYYYASETEGHCHIHPLNLQLNAIVTVSYLFLFSVLFFNKYVKHGNRGGDASRKAVIKRVTKRSPSPAKKRQ